MAHKTGRVMGDIGDRWLWRDPTKAFRFKGGRLQQAFRVALSSAGPHDTFKWFDVECVDEDASDDGPI